MKSMKKSEIMKWIPECLIAVVLSLAAIVFVPEIVNAGIGKESNLLLGVLGMLACGVITVSLAAWLRYREHKACLASLGRMLLLTVLGLIVSLVIGLLSGILAVAAYGALSGLLSVDQIKGVIDLLVTAMTVAVMPLLVSLFWTQIKSKKRFGTAMKQGLCMNGKSYRKVLISLLLCLAAGWLILTAFHYLPTNGLVTAVKILVFGGVGAAALLVTEKQCTKGA
jgi:Zn-dependent protease with chaperone function